jgi:hypothetical protein
MTEEEDLIKKLKTGAGQRLFVWALIIVGIAMFVYGLIM